MANAGVETSRIRDVDRNSKILRDIPSRLHRKFDSFTSKLNRGLDGGRHQLQQNSHRVERDLPRRPPGWVCEGHNEWNSFKEEYKHFVRSKVPILSEFSSKENLLEWLDAVESLLGEMRPPENMKCKLAYYALEGEAKQWWQQLQQQRVLRGESKITLWSRMKFLLINDFWPTICSTKCPLQVCNDRLGEKCPYDHSTEFSFTMKITATATRDQVTPRNVSSVLPAKCSTKSQYQLNNQEHGEGVAKHLMVDTSTLTKCSNKLPNNGQGEKHGYNLLDGFNHSTVVTEVEVNNEGDDCLKENEDGHIKGLPTGSMLPISGISIRENPLTVVTQDIVPTKHNDNSSHLLAIADFIHLKAKTDMEIQALGAVNELREKSVDKPFMLLLETFNKDGAPCKQSKGNKSDDHEVKAGGKATEETKTLNIGSEACSVSVSIKERLDLGCQQGGMETMIPKPLINGLVKIGNESGRATKVDNFRRQLQSEFELMNDENQFMDFDPGGDLLFHELGNQLFPKSCLLYGNEMENESAIFNNAQLECETSMATHAIREAFAHVLSVSKAFRDVHVDIVVINPYVEPTVEVNVASIQLGEILRFKYNGGATHHGVERNVVAGTSTTTMQVAELLTMASSGNVQLVYSSGSRLVMCNIDPRDCRIIHQIKDHSLIPYGPCLEMIEGLPCERSEHALCGEDRCLKCSEIWATHRKQTYASCRDSPPQKMAIKTRIHFAYAILVTPLGMVAIIFSVMVSHINLYEKLNIFRNFGHTWCVVSSVAIVLHAFQERQAESIIAAWELASVHASLFYTTEVRIAILVIVFHHTPQCSQTHITFYIEACWLLGSSTALSVKATEIALKLMLFDLKRPISLQTWFTVLLVVVLSFKLKDFIHFVVEKSWLHHPCIAQLESYCAKHNHVKPRLGTAYTSKYLHQTCLTMVVYGDSSANRVRDRGLNLHSSNLEFISFVYSRDEDLLTKITGILYSMSCLLDIPQPLLHNPPRIFVTTVKFPFDPGKGSQRNSKTSYSWWGERGRNYRPQDDAIECYEEASKEHSKIKLWAHFWTVTTSTLLGFNVTLKLFFKLVNGLDPPIKC